MSHERHAFATIAVTFFQDYAAVSKRRSDLTVDELLDAFRHTTARSKEKLPWIKFACFGDLRNEGSGSLRIDRNVIALTAAMGDYDGQEVSFEEAEARVRRAGIAAFLYTSPSHSEAAPRWRVIAVLSSEVEPARHTELISRLNGVVGGVLYRESWTLSQSYYYGFAAGNEGEHRAVYIPGDPIDLRDDLPSIGKPAGSGNGAVTGGPFDEEAAIEDIVTGAAHHVPTVQLAGYWAFRRVPLDEAIERLVDVFERAEVKDERWRKRRADVKRCVRGIYRKEAQKPLSSRPPYQINPEAPYATARMFRELRYDADDTPTLHHHRGGFYAWDGTAYPEVEVGDIRAAIYRFLDECVAPVKDKKTDEWTLVPVKPNTHRVNNVLDALRAAALLPATIAAPAWLDEVADLDPGDIIACANGLLHLPSLDLLPHTPAYFTHNALDFAFDPVVPAPAGWLAFLAQLWGDDGESIAALQEMFGYCLTADTAQQKAFLIVGPKRSGKGTITRVLARLVGTDNAVAPTLAGIGSNFGLAPLIGKQVGIISDARLSGRADQAAIAERLLNITGEDAITIDRKYKEAWTGRLGVRFLVLTNELPRLADASGALASRFIVLVMTKSFYGKEDLGLTNRLLAELPGILNWAIEGWRRLRERGHFVQPESAQEAIDALEDLGSPIGAFVRDWCVVETGANGTVDDIFLAWEGWCEEQRRDRPGDRQSFGRNLRAAVPGLVIKQRRIKNGMERLYEGIRLKSVGERTGMMPEEAQKEEGLIKQMDRDSSKWPGDVPDLRGRNAV